MMLIPILTVYIMIYQSQAIRHAQLTRKSEEINTTDSRGDGNEDFFDDDDGNETSLNHEEEKYEDVKTEAIMGSLLRENKSFSAIPIS